ncbi:hypothetical protein GCM10017782_04650 [Deinococcus ficus]|nr:hypothetical protein GCM10017782_04650 [Deinococcus ficus]
MFRLKVPPARGALIISSTGWPKAVTLHTPTRVPAGAWPLTLPVTVRAETGAASAAARGRKVRSFMASVYSRG